MTNNVMIEIQNIGTSIQNIIKKKIVLLDKVENNQIKTIDFINKRIKEMNEASLKLGNTLNDANNKKEYLEKTFKVKKDELTSLQQELNTMDEKYNILVKEYENIESKCLDVKSKLNVSAQDKLTLELDRMKHALYCEATNIVWDYSVPINSTVTGCVINKRKNYLQTFEYKREEMSSSSLTEKIWNDIENGLSENWTDIIEDIYNKENKQHN